MKIMEFILSLLLHLDLLAFCILLLIEEESYQLGLVSVAICSPLTVTFEVSV